MPEKDTEQVFCDNCRQDTDHDVTGNVGEHGETVFTCKACGSFVKLPGGLSKAETKEQLKAYKAANSGEKNLADEQPAQEDLKGGAEEAPTEPTE